LVFDRSSSNSPSPSLLILRHSHVRFEDKVAFRSFSFSPPPHLPRAQRSSSLLRRGDCFRPLSGASSKPPPPKSSCWCYPPRKRRPSSASIFSLFSFLLPPFPVALFLLCWCVEDNSSSQQYLTSFPHDSDCLRPHLSPVTHSFRERSRRLLGCSCLALLPHLLSAGFPDFFFPAPLGEAFRRLYSSPILSQSFSLLSVCEQRRRDPVRYIPPSFRFALT